MIPFEELDGLKALHALLVSQQPKKNERFDLCLELLNSATQSFRDRVIRGTMEGTLSINWLREKIAAEPCEDANETNFESLPILTQASGSDDPEYAVVGFKIGSIDGIPFIALNTIPFEQAIDYSAFKLIKKGEYERQEDGDDND